MRAMLAEATNENNFQPSLEMVGVRSVVSWKKFRPADQEIGAPGKLTDVPSDRLMPWPNSVRSRNPCSAGFAVLTYRR